MTTDNQLPDANSLGTHVMRLFKHLIDAQNCHDCGRFVPEGAGHYPNPNKYIRVCSKCLPNHIITNVGSD